MGHWVIGRGAAHLPLDFATAERDIARSADAARWRDAAATDLDRLFHDETVRALFARTVNAMRASFHAEGRSMVFETFERHDLTPAPNTSYTSVARDLDLTVFQVTNHLHTARRRFRDLALTELRSLVATDEEYRVEARELFGIDVAP